MSNARVSYTCDPVVCQLEMSQNEPQSVLFVEGIDMGAGGLGRKRICAVVAKCLHGSPARRLNSLANDMLTVALHKFVATKEAVLAQENLHTILSAEYKRAPLPTGVYMRTSMSWGGEGVGKGGGEGGGVYQQDPK